MAINRECFLNLLFYDTNWYSFNQNPPFQNSLQLYPTAQEMASTQAIHQCSINGLSFPGLSPSPSEMSFPIQKSTVLQTASTKTQSPRHILHPRRKQIQSLKSQQPPPRSTPIQQEPCQPSKLTSIREMRHQKYIPGADIPELAALYKDYEEIEWTVDKIPIKWRDNSTLEEWSKDELELRHLWLSELAGTQVWEIPEEILTSMELSSYSTGEA